MEKITLVLIWKYLPTLLIFIMIFLLSFLKIKRLNTSILWHAKCSYQHIQNIYNEIKFTVLVPCLNEYKNIVQFVNYFENIIHMYPNVKVVFIISGKSDDISSIISFWKNAISTERITYFIVPIGFSNNKAEQLNYFIKNKIKGSRTHYVVIYDADSRPDLSTLKIAEFCIISKKFPLILQQPPIFNPIGRFIQKIDGLFQTLWTFHYEIYYWIKNQEKIKNLMYVIGHGIFIRSDFLLKNPFPPYEVEDLSYGYVLTLKDISPIILPVFDYSQSPKAFRQFIRQKAKWYKVSLKALCVTFNKILETNNFKKIHLLFKRFLWDLEWGFINILMIVLLSVMMCDTIAVKLIMYFLWISLYYFIPLNIFYDYTTKIGIFKINISLGERFLLSFIYSIIYNLGPIIGLLNCIIERRKKV